MIKIIDTTKVIDKEIANGRPWIKFQNTRELREALNFIDNGMKRYDWNKTPKIEYKVSRNLITKRNKTGKKIQD